MKFWNWDPKTIWHDMESVYYFLQNPSSMQNNENDANRFIKAIVPEVTDTGSCRNSMFESKEHDHYSICSLYSCTQSRILGGQTTSREQRTAEGMSLTRIMAQESESNS